ncbi:MULTISPECIES: SLC13 family permease [unclassified Streptomyces]|uniref:SLC13 family permease n=1 Tax=unclassified Streptomyces TaxID=2593676 RepID=UPI002DDAA4AE|nr:SLC13 family permease [Streptomyces sp. NBC_01237]WRZ70480.1 SLC13 family permease [Streptomyces sp. NBC_01237]
MSDHVISLIGLVLIFTVATVFSVHMGALAIVVTFVVGTAFVHESADDIFAGFPGDLFVVLVGVTFLFAIAKNNGTVSWLVHGSMRVVRGRIALIPWIMFLVTAVLTAVGAVVPAAVALVAPIGLGFAKRYRINPLLMGLLIINGASAGGFSPISVFGSITNGVMSRNDLPGNPALLFLCSFLFNVVLSLFVFFLFGGRALLGRRETVAGPGAADGKPRVAGDSVAGGLGAGGGGSRTAAAPSGFPTSSTVAPTSGGLAVAVAGEPVEEPPLTLDRARALTLLGLLGLVAGSLFFDLNVGLMALTVTVVLSLASPESAKGAVDECAWSTVLLVCGIVTFVSLMERIGTIGYLGEGVASVRTPLLGALLICLIGAVVSAFASTTGILGALIPLSVPFLLGGQVGTVGLIAALAISASVVDSSPFSTSGALVVANSPEERRDTVFRGLMVWGLAMAAVVPLVTWGLFVVPGWD